MDLAPAALEGTWSQHGIDNFKALQNKVIVAEAKFVVKLEAQVSSNSSALYVNEQHRMTLPL